MGTRLLVWWLMVLVLMTGTPALAADVNADDSGGSPELALPVLYLMGDVEGPYELDLKRVVELAHQQNLDVALAKNDIRYSRWEQVAAGSQMLPSVGFKTQVEKLTGGQVLVAATPLAVNRVTLSPRLTLEYDVQKGVRGLFQLRVSRHRVLQSELAYDQSHQQALLDVLTRYYEALRDARKVPLSKQILSEAETERKTNEARYETGFGTQLAVEQSAVLEIEREGDLLEAKNESRLSEIALTTILQLPFGARVSLADQDLYPRIFWPDEELSLEKVYAMTLENRPEVKELDETVREARATLWATASEAVPNVHLNAYVGVIGPEPGEFRRTFYRGVSVDVDLLEHLGLKLLSHVKMDHAKIREAVLKKEQELQRIQNDLARAYHNWLLYRQQLEVYERKQKSAQEAFRIARARRETGVGIELEVIQAKTKLDEARQQYLGAVADYNIAQLRLLFETGQLTPGRVLSPLEVTSGSGSGD